MHNVKKCLSIALITLIPTVSFATLKRFTNSDCTALAMPKTVLLVHASWCSHCKAFLPIYSQVSNKEKYKDWIFFEMVNDNFKNVCGSVIKGVPVTFKNNMKNNIVGNKSQSALEDFLDSIT